MDKPASRHDALIYGFNLLCVMNLLSLLIRNTFQLGYPGFFNPEPWTQNRLT